MNVHFSSKTDDWATPQDFFDGINKEFSLNLDVCASTLNHKLPMWFSEEEDGLSKDWSGSRCWMNPPYGREIGKWVKRASEAKGGGSGMSVASQNRYEVVPRLHLWQSGDQVYQRKARVRQLKELSTLS